MRVFHLTNEEYFRPRVSATFHGRDVFAPVAGALSTGVAPEELGEEIKDYVRLPAPQAEAARHGKAIEAPIIHIDRFGNCITNLTPDDVTEEMIAGGARLVVNGREITTFRRFFAEGGDGAPRIVRHLGQRGLPGDRRLQCVRRPNCSAPSADRINHSDE